MSPPAERQQYIENWIKKKQTEIESYNWKQSLNDLFWVITAISKG